MKASLRSIGCDWLDLSNYQPEQDDCFQFLAHLCIGPVGEEGINHFDVFICTPEWLCKHHWVPELMRHTLLVRKYDLDEITKTITDYIDQCEGNDWMEIAQKLSRVFAWEFEDYQPYQP